MSLLRRRLAENLSALGLVVSAVPAFAALPPITPIPNLCSSYTATLADCQNPVSLCAKVARDAAETNPNAICNTLIKNAATSAAGGMGQRTVMVPPTLNAAGQVVAPDAATKSVAFLKDDANALSLSGLSGFYLGTVHRAQAYFPATTPFASRVKLSRSQQRTGWENSGNVINSCAEYVFEKYYDYSVFEDAIAAAGTDYRAIYNIAYGVALNGNPVPVSAIGTRGISSPTQRGRDATAFQPSITFPTGLPKNEFFTVPANVQGKVIINQGTEDKAAAMPGVRGAAIITLKNSGRLMNLYGTVLPTAMRTTLNQGASYYNESWSWHKSMGQRNAAVLDEEMYSLERMKSDFAALLRQRQQLVSTIQSEVGNQYRPLPGTLQAGAAQGAMLDDEDPVNPLVGMAYSLVALDAAIEAALLTAQSRGCLAFQSATAPAPCDWSPKRFAQRVLNLYQTPREQAFQKCVDYTNDDFAALKSKALVIAGKVNYPAQDYTTRPSVLETYFPRRDAYLNALSAATGAVRDPYTAALRMKWEAGDSYSLGDETFGATADYQVSTEIKNVTASDCAMSPEVYGRFDATGRAFSTSVQLVHAEARISDTRADVDLDVLDNTIPVLDVHRDLVAGQFNLVSGSKSKSATLVDVETTFVIVVVPVTLGAKVAGVVGLDYSVGGEHKVTPIGSTGCRVNSISLAGKIEPYAKVDGELYAGVDLFIVQAGVKGKLQLVHASVPIEATVGLNYGANGASAFTLGMAGKADLKFTFLSGSIAAYLEVGIWPLEEEFEATIVSWDGIHDDVKLFDKNVSVLVADLRAL
ncbi:hypothetical protein HUW62_25060 [Myxococcus sp. AM011]|uniref:hypothetical protein n=1 Tax=Myxococcus sp. AM011 TaxID=2745200 RepID=UPI001595FE25|nr:hypothetical protein [Myxococcus sp. AM011]NVJ24500.1 hypothetical protein [Myxococcus sp. AM011]